MKQLSYIIYNIIRICIIEDSWCETPQMAEYHLHTVIFHGEIFFLRYIQTHI